MKKHELLLASKLLKIASESFARHCCNDLPKEIRNSLTEEQWEEINKKANEWNGTPEEHKPGDTQIKWYDWYVMSYCAKKLKEEAELLLE